MKTIRSFFIFSLWFCVGASFFGCAPSSHLEEDFQAGRFAPLVGGTLVKERSTDASKSVVYLEFLNQHNQKISSCTATLIGPQSLLTAAHCFDPNRLRIASFRVVFEYRGGSRKILTGVGFSMHRRYNKKKLFDHDLAVAVFEGALPSGFAPVNIDSDQNANYAHQKVYVYGYGRFGDETTATTDKAPKSNPKSERGMLRRGVMIVGGDYNQFPDRYLTSADSATFLCAGDSGGPQFYHENGVLKLIGVSSAHFGELLPSGKRACTGAAQATKVAPFYEWILTEQKKLLNRMK